MHYRYFVVTVVLILALVMTSGCTGLLMGDLKAEISDRSAITIPLPLSSVLSALASHNTATPPVNQSSTGEKADTISANPLPGKSPFQVKSSTEDPAGIDTESILPATVQSPQVVERRHSLSGCNPVNRSYHARERHPVTRLPVQKLRSLSSGP